MRQDAAVNRSAVRWMVPPTAVAAVAVCALVAAALGPADALPLRELPLFLLDLTPVALGWLVALRARRGPVAPALAWTGAATIGTRAVEVWGETYQSTAPWPGSEIVAVIGRGFWPWQLLGFAALMLLFPSGLLAGRRWRVLAWSVPVAAALINIGMAAPAGTPVNEAPASWQVPFIAVGLPLLLVSLLGASASLFVRFRAGDLRTRQQLQWIMLAGGSVPLLLAASWGLVALGVPGDFAYAGFLIGMLVLVPASVTLAILRHDLFDIDRLLGSSLAWLLTSLVSAAVFATGVLLGSQLLGANSRVGVTTAGFVMALCLLPIHHRLHTFVGRALDSERTVMLRQVGQFVDDVREGRAEPEAVESVLQVALGDPGLRLLLSVPGHSAGYVDLNGEAAVVGDAVDERCVPLVTGEHQVGTLILGAVSERRRRRARDAALAARLPIEVSRLRVELREALSDVRASRARLSVASAAERRRLERDLHDGAQQRIVAVGMQLRAAQRQLTPDQPAYRDLDLAVESLEDTVIALRELAHGVRPGQLDDGLAASLAKLVRDSGMAIELDVEDLELPDVVSTTAYFVVAEAITNAMKHAAADRIEVSVRKAALALQVRIRDNGIGGAHEAFGLTSMRDRVASVGGELFVHSEPAEGTEIRAVIPCAS